LNNNVPNKQHILERWGSESSVTQKVLDKAILRFIIENIQPLSTVDSPAFIDLIRIGLPSHIRIIYRKIVICRKICRKKTLKEKLCQMYVTMKTALEKKLTRIELVATTADLWSKAKKLIYIIYISNIIL